VGGWLVDPLKFAKQFPLFWTMLSLDAWDFLVAEQPSSEEWHIAIRFGSCHNL
jgi:hypothetical protein